MIRPVIVLVNVHKTDLLLTPENAVRAFKGATIELKSTHFFSSIAEGHFWWKHNDSLCLTETCRCVLVLTLSAPCRLYY